MNNSIWHYFDKLFENHVISGVGMALAASCAFLAGGDALIMYLLIVLIFIDGITGWLRASKNGEKPTSDSLRIKTFKKLIVYISLLAVVGILRIILAKCGIDLWLSQPVHLAIAGWVGATECISILENLSEFCGDSMPFLKRLHTRLVTIGKHIECVVLPTSNSESDEDDG